QLCICDLNLTPPLVAKRTLVLYLQSRPADMRRLVLVTFVCSLVFQPIAQAGSRKDRITAWRKARDIRLYGEGGTLATPKGGLAHERDRIIKTAHLRKGKLWRNETYRAAEIEAILALQPHAPDGVTINAAVMPEQRLYNPDNPILGEGMVDVRTWV